MGNVSTGLLLTVCITDKHTDPSINSQETIIGLDSYGQSFEFALSGGFLHTLLHASHEEFLPLLQRI